MTEKERLTKLETHWVDHMKDFKEVRRDVRVVKYVLIAYLASKGVINLPDIALALNSLF